MHTKPSILMLLECALAALIASPAHANSLKLPNGDTLTGDAKLACEAILCLSSAAGSGTSECTPALSRYFSFDGWNAIVDRINFLHACPLGDMDGKDGFIDAMAHGAGNCDAATLNRTQMREKTFSHCAGNECRDVKKFDIDNRLPENCKAWLDNPYTDWHVRYRGSPVWQEHDDFIKHPAGLWVE